MTYRIIIHVGPPKTGSTALQEFFSINRALLLRNGVFYPVGLVVPEAHHEIPNIITDSMSRFHRWVPNAEHISLIEVLKSYFDEINFREISTLMLSSEDFADLNSDHYAKFIESLSEAGDISIEFVYLDFDPAKRLESYVNQFIRQGEYVDDDVRNQIFERIKNITKNFLSATTSIPAVVHRIDYHQLKNSTDIFEKLLGLILNEHTEWELDDWSIPIRNLNVSIKSEKIALLNQFNAINNGERLFDSSCPVLYSTLYPTQADRFNDFVKLLNSVPEGENPLADRKTP
jgi:hypothetical protein